MPENSQAFILGGSMDRYKLKKGFNKIFVGELFSFISSIMNYILVILSTWAVTSITVEREKVTIGLIVVIAGVVVMLFSFIGLIVSILGLRQIREEDSSFQKSFIAMFVMIVSAIVGSFLTNNEKIGFVINEIPQIINVFALFYLLNGMETILKQSSLKTKIIVACFIVVCLGDLWIHFNPLQVSILIVLACLLCIGYILLLMLIAKAKMEFKDL